MNAFVAIAIAVTKAVLIVLFFMNTYYSTRLTWVFVIFSFFWLLILFGMFLPYCARLCHPTQRVEQHAVGADRHPTRRPAPNG